MTDSGLPRETLVVVGAISTTFEQHQAKGLTYGEWAAQVRQYIEDRGYKIVPQDSSGDGVETIEEAAERVSELFSL